jgi:uncharacterized protein
MIGSSISLAVLARTPELGNVKTRLQSIYSAEQVLALYEAMLRDTLEMVSSVRGEFRRVAVHWSGKSETVLANWKQEFPSVDHQQQVGRDLGERLHRALSNTSADGPAIAIGCDSPTLPPEFLLRAVSWLEAGDHSGGAGRPIRHSDTVSLPSAVSSPVRHEVPDIVIGPARDGGYYLVGMRSVSAGLFENIQWGSCDVLLQSLRRAEEWGLTCRLLPEWYDLDSPADLVKATRETNPGRWDARHFRACIAGMPRVRVLN